MPSLQQAIVNRFKRCGLYPYNPNAVDYSKCIQNKLENNANIETNMNPDQDISHQDLHVTERVLSKAKDELMLQGINADAVMNALRNIFEKEAIPEKNQTPIGTFEIQSDGELLDVDVDPNINANNQPNPVSPLAVDQNYDNDDDIIDKTESAILYIDVLDINNLDVDFLDSTSKENNENNKGIEEMDVEAVGCDQSDNGFETNYYYQTKEVVRDGTFPLQTDAIRSLTHVEQEKHKQFTFDQQVINGDVINTMNIIEQCSSNNKDAMLLMKFNLNENYFRNHLFWPASILSQTKNKETSISNILCFLS